VTVPWGPRGQGGPSSLGREIHGEYTCAREDDWSYLPIFSFPDRKGRQKSVFCRGRVIVVDLHSFKVVILPLERYIKEKFSYVFMYVHTCTCIYTFSYTYFPLTLFLVVFKECLPRKE